MRVKFVKDRRWKEAFASFVQVLNNGSVPEFENVSPNRTSSPQKMRRSEEGTALVEVTMAMFVVAFTAAAIVASYNYGFFAMGLARENQRATQVILEKAETIRLYRWDKLDTVPTVFSDTYDPHATNGDYGVVYHGTCSIENVPFSASYSTNLRQVTINLTWTNQNKGLVRTRTLQTLIAEDGIQNYVY